MAALAAGFPVAPSPSRVLPAGVGSRLPTWAPLRAETTHVQEAIVPRGSCREKEHLKHECTSYSCGGTVLRYRPLRAGPSLGAGCGV